MFQRRHYEFVADVIAGIADEGIREHVAQEFSRAFDRTQPGFKPERFLKRCERDAIPMVKRVVFNIAASALR